ncbi:MAG: hypothetical protein V2A76_19045 [Planctomycetota bacterium]
MSATSSNSPLSLRLVPLFALLFSAPAMAGNDVWYPVNPYHGRASFDKPPVERPRATQPLPNYQWNEYPNGPNGPRVVKIVLSHDDLLRAENRMLDGLLADEREAALELRRAEDVVFGLSQRLSRLAPFRQASRQHYETWIDLVDEKNRFDAHATEVRRFLENCRLFQENLHRMLSRPQPTTVVVNVRNHQNREYIPTDYLRQKAIEHVLANPEGAGETLRLEF